MSYVPTRDGLAACPDDPARVAAPMGWSAKDEAEYFRDLAERQEWHFYRIKPMVVAAMAGHISCCPVLHKGSIQRLEGADIWDAITVDMDSKDLARLLAGYLNKDAHSAAAFWAAEQIDAYCNKTAAFMAEQEVHP